MSASDRGIVVLLSEAPEAEARAFLAELASRRRDVGEGLVAVVDEEQRAQLAEPLRRIGSDAVVGGEALSQWIAARPGLRSLEVVPRGAALADPPQIGSSAPEFVAWCIPATTLDSECYVEHPAQVISWLCSRAVLDDLCHLSAPASWSSVSPIRAVQNRGRPIAWRSTRVSDRPPPASRSADPNAPISRARSVLAVIPYHAREEWLAPAIGSIVTQTRRPDAIVVVDDASPTSPQAIVERFPGVTLLRSPSCVGPYRLIQQVIDDTRFDAYLFQDADDFSAVDRLERLLEEGELSGAHLIGTQALWFDDETGSCGLASAPTIVPPPSEKSVYSLLHPSSIVTRDLLVRLGGHATGLRFGGDLELQLRALQVTTLVNTPWCSYFKRRHRGSLTADPETGIFSPARVELRNTLRRRLAESLAAAAPDLTPFRTSPPIALTRICGPSLSPSGS